MIKWGIFLLLLIIAGCNNPSSRQKINDKTAAPVKSKARTARPAANPWTVSSFAPKDGQTEGIKFVRFVTEGDFSDSLQNNNFLYAEIIVNTASAGIFLHERNRSNPAEKFSEPVQIKMINSSGQELQMTSSRRWNNSGGILIERNNNDYSQLRIFLLQSKGTISVEVKDSGTKIYHFNINADGFGDSFSRL